MLIVAKQVYRFRKALNWSQKYLSDQTGITQPKISRIEQGTGKANADELESLAKAFNVRVQDLLEETEVTPKIVFTKGE